MNLNRRDFIKSVAAITATPLLINSALSKSGLSETLLSVPLSATKTILFDSSKCTGCHSCEIACRVWNNIPEEQPSWTLVTPIENYTRDDGQQLFGKYQCMHCIDAACVEVCPTGALTKHPSGFVAYDISKCSGCGYCVQFCPFKAPYMEGNALTGLQRMHKCTFCADRLSTGKQPACVEVCPTNALTFGNRSDLLNASADRINTLKGNYHDTVLYGENELDGLQVMYLLLQSPDIYKLPPSPEIPASIPVWKDLIQPLGFITAAVLALGLGFNYLIARATLKEKDITDNKP